MFVKMTSFMNGDSVIVNTNHVVRVVEMKEHKGCVMTLADCSKIMVSHSMDEVWHNFMGVIDMTVDPPEEGER